MSDHNQDVAGWNNPSQTSSSSRPALPGTTTANDGVTWVVQPNVTNVTLPGHAAVVLELTKAILANPNFDHKNIDGYLDLIEKFAEKVLAQYAKFHQSYVASAGVSGHSGSSGFSGNSGNNSHSGSSGHSGASGHSGN